MIDRRKKYYLVVDVETANSLDDPLVYDIGFLVGDKQGNIYEKYSFSVWEMFQYYTDLLTTAYYAEKLPNYTIEEKNGLRVRTSLGTIRRLLVDTMIKYNITEVYAYNCYFDRKALNATRRYFTKSEYRWFFPYGTKFSCIWNMACTTIFQQKTFRDKAKENGWYGKNGKNITTNAETAFKYISGNSDFEEEHKGLADVIIEYDILLRCIRQHKKMVKDIDRQCWRKVK